MAAAKTLAPALGSKGTSAEQAMQARAIVAEQTSTNRYWPPTAAQPWDIELTIRLEFPEGEGADVGIWPRFAPILPGPWEDALNARLSAGVHAGIARVGEPLPAGGIGVYITELRFSPPVGSERPEGIRHVGDALEALTASTVAALWAGLISFDPPGAR